MKQSKLLICIAIMMMVLGMIPQKPVEAVEGETPADFTSLESDCYDHNKKKPMNPCTSGDWQFSIIDMNGSLTMDGTTIGPSSFNNGIMLEGEPFVGKSIASIKSAKGAFKLNAFTINNFQFNNINDLIVTGYKDNTFVPGAEKTLKIPENSSGTKVTFNENTWNNIDELRISLKDEEAYMLSIDILNIDVDDPIVPVVPVDPPMPLEKVLTPSLALSVAAEWTAVTHATGYNVQLYKNGTPIGSSIDTIESNINLINEIQSAGPGLYKVTVQAKGNGTTYTDGPVSEASNEIEIIKLPIVSNLSWKGNIAKWTDGGAGPYIVQLYKNGVPIGQAVNSSQKSYDFSSVITSEGLGSYTFTVIDKGNGTWILDSDPSDASGTNNITAGKLNIIDKTAQAGEAVDIPVVLSNGNEPVAIKFNIGFDTNNLEFIGIKNSTVHNTGLILGNSDPQENGDILTLGGTSNNASITDGEVAVLEFKVKDGVAGGQDALVNLSGIEVSDINGKASQYSNSSAKISIEKNNNADLRGLTLSEGLILNETFNKDNLNYTVTIPRDMQLTSFTVTPIVDYSRSTITGNGNALTNSQTSFPVIFDGINTEVTIVVTSESGNSSKTYTISVTKEAPKSSDANLGHLSLNDQETPIVDFSNGLANGETTFTYALNNPTRYEVDVKGFQSDMKATMALKVNGVVVPSPPSVTLKPGLNKIEVTVAAEDGVTVKTYTVFVTLGLKGDADLDGDVDINDWQLVARFILHKSTPNAQAKWNSDLNDNGEISINDWVGIANMLLDNNNLN
ncbi:cadherin-like beta sandwich domain-containing protein [Bacillus sp. S/N-304-OC-R1]|uniref:cadherin-like beta sandwich domain-containing protein n=1 Tax=Bacillus sp. S/N-304-OC-R1 TaxID=2758034 RepID=UPI001C8EF2F5|nr:cadherin-like beta sandwich domain-containing protein [Bacillus sp. S/N-304-OC-R1]MBY0121145.1 cadherin-like beta sandwich domain-containing protein [Bacillus sp. S/N-304-OC-R1]